MKYWVETVLPLDDITPTTRASYEWGAGYVVAILGNVPLADIKPAHVRKLLTVLKEKEPLPRSQKNVRTTFGKALRNAEIDELILRNAVRLSDPVKIPRTSKEVITSQQLTQLIDYIQGHEIRTPGAHPDLYRNA